MEPELVQEGAPAIQLAPVKQLDELVLPQDVDGVLNSMRPQEW